ncbi:hypothetical protein E4K72_02350 [Oxalobacteraceae bacterium OM1]|nr:hypothetical protein E4K72_02350 [Oxalobacteraceae bacterium OM1]
MNELPTSSGAPSSPPPAAAPVRTPLIPVGQRPVWGAVAALTALLLAQWWSSHQELKTVREEVAQRLKSGDTLNAETKVMVRSVQDSIKELQAKVNVLESKQVEAQGQQLALEQLYQDLSKNRDDWALAEIEQVLSTASQQLQLAGNVQGAIIALQNADNRLSRSDKPQFIQIRRAIARDLDRLKVLPAVDITGIALRLDAVISQIDSMPLLSDEKPVTAATPPKPSRRLQKAQESAKAPIAKSNGNVDWVSDLQEKWQSWSNEMWTDIKDLIRVRKVDSSDALLLSPTQAYYARENLKLRLLNARLALLARNENAFRSDLVAAQDVIAKYFDTRAKQTQTTQALLRQVQSSNLAIEMPTLSDSLNAVRNYKAKP